MTRLLWDNRPAPCLRVFPWCVSILLQLLVVRHCRALDVVSACYVDCESRLVSCFADTASVERGFPTSTRSWALICRVDVGGHRPYVLRKVARIPHLAFAFFMASDLLLFCFVFFGLPHQYLPLGVASRQLLIFVRFRSEGLLYGRLFNTRFFNVSYVCIISSLSHQSLRICRTFFWVAC